MAGLIRVREGSSDDGAEFANVTHVNATHTRIERERPAHGSVCPLLRSHGSYEVLVEERRDDERMIRKPRFLDYPIDLGLVDRKSTRLNSSHRCISYAVFCLKKKKK